MTRRRRNLFIAQGKRSGALGNQCKASPRPVGAKDLYMIGLQTFAPTGRLLVVANFPKAVPWAMRFCPCGANYLYQLFAHNGATTAICNNSSDCAQTAFC